MFPLLGMIRRIVKDFVLPKEANPDIEERILHYEFQKRYLYEQYKDPRILDMPIPKIDPPYGPGNFGNAIRPFYTMFYDNYNKSFSDLFNSAKKALTPVRRDPLILDLDGDGIETTNLRSGAYFDHDGNGFAEQTGWVDPDDGLLVRDINGNGRIDSGKELFGDQTILKNGSNASNGFQALSDLDDNHDGKIDSNDAAFSQLKVWQDIDGDGYSSAGELKSLSDAGITGINLNSIPSSTTDPEGNTQTRIGSFEKADGTTGQIANFNLQRDTAYTIAEEWLEVPEDIAVLPDLLCY